MKHPDLEKFNLGAQGFAFCYEWTCYNSNNRPLQLYDSALVWCSDRNVIRQIFADQLPVWIEQTSHQRVERGSRDSYLPETCEISPNTQLIAVRKRDATIEIWDSATFTSQGIIKAGFTSDETPKFFFSPNSQVLACIPCNGCVTLWDPSTRRLRASLCGHRSGVKDISFSFDRKLLASADGDGRVRLWDLIARRRRARWKGHSGKCRVMAFSPDGSLLAFECSDLCIRLWHIPTRQLQSVLVWGTRDLSSLIFSSDSRLLKAMYTSCYGMCWDLIFWNIEEGSLRNFPLEVTSLRLPCSSCQDHHLCFEGDHSYIREDQHRISNEPELLSFDDEDCLVYKGRQIMAIPFIDHETRDNLLIVKDDEQLTFFQIQHR